jgi:hypothetical protein
MNNSDYLDVDDAAEDLGVSRQVYFLMAREGRVPVQWMGNRKCMIPRGVWETFKRNPTEVDSFYYATKEEQLKRLRN